MPSKGRDETQNPALRRGRRIYTFRVHSSQMRIDTHLLLGDDLEINFTFHFNDQDLVLKLSSLKKFGPNTPVTFGSFAFMFVLYCANNS